MTVGLEFLLPARGVVGGGAMRLVRPPDVPPNEVSINDPNKITLHHEKQTKLLFDFCGKNNIFLEIRIAFDATFKHALRMLLNEAFSFEF